MGTRGSTSPSGSSMKGRSSLHSPTPFPEPTRSATGSRRFPFISTSRICWPSTCKGVSVLYNTYWVRFNHRLFTHADAVRNTLPLFEAAKKAGVQRIVHVSITNPVRGFAPGVFPRQGDPGEGPRRIRDLPCHPSAGRPLRQGRHPHQQHRLGPAAAAGLRRVWRRPLSVAADLRRRPGGTGGRAGRGSGNVLINALGPETFTYRELVTRIGQRIGKTRPIVSVPPWFGYAAGRLLGRSLGT